jgi:hypothetical protein
MEMGKMISNTEERNVRLFNTPIEIGLRSLFLLAKFQPKGLSIDKLIYLDYFLIHASDVSKKQKSIHPKYPFRSSEIIVKRQLLMYALKFLLSKELVHINFSKTGIEYIITNIGIKILDYFQSDYSQDIRNTSTWIHNSYHDYSEEQLSEVIKINIQKWGNEFSNEAKFRGISS